ncbi:TPA: thioredoxin reductase [Candidatus Micrarchaeota archaeon]|nr:thioredoxin reductase [Candidatus Micrarchaeota archaeon]
MAEQYDTIIIGGGVAGFSAAMYAGRLKLKTLVIGDVKGGTLITTNDIRNWPGIKVTDGITLAKQVEEHAMEYDIDFKLEKAVSLEPEDSGYVVKTKKESFSTKTVILATGTEVRKLGVPGEKEFDGKGVHYCALCDGFFYKDKVIGVVGGSDSAAKEAILLTQWAKKVYIIYRKENIRAEPFNLEAVNKSDRIEIINNTNVTEILGDDKVNSVKLDKPYEGKDTLPLDAVFVEIGHIPLSALGKQAGLELNERGEIKINRNCETSMPGVFAAGDVVDDRFKQAIVGSAEGVIAAYSAYEYLRK